ncbi:MAG: Tripartite tricarboxylate transporter TctB family protein [Spirochaetes bacterium ADurb.Bin110]|jgi:lysylphosphatidylglycerol synthetase-like protein (DUF2156 family)|nr:MAG: Tripartite tricarboxylate transporter TctB family protein [Spirochaetes bacterium ADurb.Bin110]
MTDSTMNKADFYTSIVLLIVSLSIIIISIQMPSMTERNESQWSNPGVVPTFIGIALFLLSGSMLLRAIKRGAVKKNESKNFDSNNGTISVEDVSSVSKSPDMSSLLSNPYFRILITIVLCSLYAFMLGKIWFPLATFIFILLFIVVFEFDSQRPLRSQGKTLLWGMVLAACTSAAVTVVFQYLFLVNLP